MSVVFKGIVAGAIPNNSAASRAVPAPATVGTDNGADPTVNPTPVSQAAGPATVAYGAPINLTVAPTYPGARYVWVWDGPTPWGSSEQNPTFPTPRTPGPFDPGPAPVIPGMHRFTVTVTLGTCSYSSFVDVTVLPSTLPHLTLTDVGPVLCPGASDLTYTVTGNPFPAGTTIRAELSSPSHSYSKIIGSTDLGGLGTHTLKVKVPHLRPRTSSYYRVELSASSPFDADSKTTSITDVPPLDSLQVSSNSPVMAGDTVKLKASYSSAYGSQPFAWTFTPVGGSPRFFSNEYNPRIPNAQAAQSGRYHVTANGYFGCTDTASVRVLVIPTEPLASRTGALQAAARLYPNPAAGTATLEVAGLKGPDEVRVELLNTLGQVVFNRGVLPRAGAVRLRLDLARLPAGVYSVRLSTKQGSAVKRLMHE